MYVAAVTLNLGDRVAKAGDEVPEALTWPRERVAQCLRDQSIVFVPPQLLTFSAEPSPAPSARRARR